MRPPSHGCIFWSSILLLSAMCSYFSTGYAAFCVVIFVLLGVIMYERHRADAECRAREVFQAQAAELTAQAAEREAHTAKLEAYAASTIERIATHGLPYFAAGSGGYSSASKNGLHAAALVSNVLLLPLPPGPILPAPESAIWTEVRCTAGRGICWKSESDIQHCVRLVIIEIIAMSGLDLMCSNEVTIVGMRPDIWVIILHGRPVGVLEVKTPQRGILESPAVLGQNLDYMRVLRHQLGVADPYAIATTFEQWRVLHLPANDDPAKRGRFVEATPVIDGYGDPAPLCAALLATLSRMRHSPLQLPVSDHPTSLDTMCAYMRVDKTSWKWVTTSATLLNYCDMPTGNQFILVRDLGAGAHGHAWLACSDTGRVCVLKICRRHVAAAEFSWSSASAQRKDQEQLLRAELQAWNMVNKGACPAADLVFIAGKPALRMPYVVTVTRGDCDADVAAAVLRMAGIRLWHHDLHWRMFVRALAADASCLLTLVTVMLASLCRNGVRQRRTC